MVLKAEAHRRHEAREARSQGTSPTSSGMAKQPQRKATSQKSAPPKPVKQTTKSPPARSVKNDILIATNTNTQKSGNINSTASDASSTVEGRPITDAKVMVYHTTPIKDNDGLIESQEEHLLTIEAHRLHTLSQRFCDELASLPWQRTKGGILYKWVIDDSAASKKAIVKLMRWLRTVHLPFPATFTGIKQMYPNPSWGIDACAALFRFTQWLDLKPPFDNPVFYGRCRDYIMDGPDRDPIIVIDIWKGLTGRKQWLRRVLLDRLVGYVENLDEVDDMTRFYRPNLGNFRARNGLLWA
jgi:hypothetical protein